MWLILCYFVVTFREVEADRFSIKFLKIEQYIVIKYKKNFSLIVYFNLIWHL